MDRVREGGKQGERGSELKEGPLPPHIPPSRPSAQGPGQEGRRPGAAHHPPSTPLPRPPSFSSRPWSRRMEARSCSSSPFHPPSPTPLLQLKALVKKDGGPELLIIINPQWETKGLMPGQSGRGVCMQRVRPPLPVGDQGAHAGAIR